MKSDSRKAHVAALGVALVMAALMAAPAAAGEKTARPHKKSVRTSSGRDSGETVSERERRLYRECRGRPNAGACEGYAR